MVAAGVAVGCRGDNGVVKNGADTGAAAPAGGVHLVTKG